MPRRTITDRELQEIPKLKFEAIAAQVRDGLFFLMKGYPLKIPWKKKITAYRADGAIVIDYE